MSKSKIIIVVLILVSLGGSIAYRSYTQEPMPEPSPAEELVEEEPVVTPEAEKEVPEKKKRIVSSSLNYNQGTATMTVSCWDGLNNILAQRALYRSDCRLTDTEYSLFDIATTQYVDEKATKAASDKVLATADKYCEEQILPPQNDNL